MSTCTASPPSPRPTFVLMDGPPLRGPDDWLRRFREGDRLVLERIYRTYVGSVTTIVRGGVTSSSGTCPRFALEHEARDLVQEVFLRAFAPAARRSFDGKREYGPYLYAVARNVVIDWARRERREIPTAWEEIQLLADTALPCPSEDPERDPHLHTVVAHFLDTLDPTLRALVEVRYQRGLSQREGAEALGLSRQSLRTLESRLQTGLRRALKQHTLSAA